MSGNSTKQKVVVVGAGPVGALAALYAANRGDDVHVYELRGGMYAHVSIDLCYSNDILSFSVHLYWFSPNVFSYPYLIQGENPF